LIELSASGETDPVSPAVPSIWSSIIGHCRSGPTSARSTALRARSGLVMGAAPGAALLVECLYVVRLSFTVGVSRGSGAIWRQRIPN